MNAFHVGALQALAPEGHEFGVKPAEVGETRQLDYPTLHSWLLSKFHSLQPHHLNYAPANTSGVAVPQGDREGREAQWSGSITISPFKGIANIFRFEDKPFTLEVSSADTVGGVKGKIQDRGGPPADQQHLIYGGKTLEDAKTLEECNVKSEGTLHMVPRRGTQITVKTLTGMPISLMVEPDDKIESLKAKIEGAVSIPVDTQHLEFKGQPLEDGKTLMNYFIIHQSVIQLALRHGGNPSYYQIDPDTFHTRFDYDFTDEQDNGDKYVRGTEVYRRPYGWKRLAIRVLGKYGEDDTWFGKAADKRTESSEGEWPVSYHGTGLNQGKTIAAEGFEKTRKERHTYSYGVYTTPDFEVAEKYASEHKFEDGTIAKVLLQNRVNPRTLQKFSEDVTGKGEGEYWVSPSEDDVRPYGICVKVLVGPATAPSTEGCTIM